MSLTSPAPDPVQRHSQLAEPLLETAVSHAVRFYNEESSLIDELVRFIGGALVAGDAAVAVATESHRRELAERLRARGLDLEWATKDGRYIELDAADTLSRFMQNGQPDAERFGEVIGPIIDRAASACGAQSRVAVFGELVALLCAEGNHSAAVQLERLWNDFARTRAFSLLCGYPIDVFPQAADGETFAEICAAHTRLIPAEDYVALDDDGERLRMIALLQQKARALETEIQERKKVEALLQRREAELADFIEEVPVALHWVGPDGSILWANRAELELLGYCREEYIGRNVAEFHASQDDAADILTRLSRRETLRDHEARLRRKDGSIRDVLINSNVHWEDGKFVHTRCVTLDITDRLLADEARARLAAIVDSTDDAIISKTLNGTITSWNHAAERLYGYTAAEVVGGPITVIVPPDRRDELAGIMERLSKGERIAHHETVRVRKDGAKVEVSVTISPIYDRTGKIIGASKTARDISERRAFEQRKREFLEMVAHDLGSPLTVVRGYAQLLQRRGTYDERAVAAIADKTALMGRLVADMLDVTRLEAGRLELRRSDVDLVAVARECIAEASLMAGDRPVQVEAPERPIIGEWDADRLEQVITNLLNNALKYAPDGEVVVRLTACSDEAQVAVIDQGPGLEPHEIQRVFDHYFRGPRTASATSGAGLGLFICKALIEAHGGRLWVESAPKQGSTFAFSLPYAPPPQ